MDSGGSSKTGYTSLCLREGHDATNNEDYNDDSVWKTSGAVFRTSETSGTSQDPYLEITYTIPSYTTPAPTDLETDQQINPSGLVDARPGFNAIFHGRTATSTAVSYQIQIATSTSGWASPVWDSGEQGAPGSRRRRYSQHGHRVRCHHDPRDKHDLLLAHEILG